jgi:hypothetical protein
LNFKFQNKIVFEVLNSQKCKGKKIEKQQGFIFDLYCVADNIGGYLIIYNLYPDLGKFSWV